MDLAGELIHRVTIQVKTVERDENGFDSDVSWRDYAKVWVKITPMSVRDVLAAQALQSKTVARMKMRYRTDITTEMRVIHRQCIYAIDSPPLRDANSGLEYQTFMLSGGIEKYVG